MDVFWHPLKPLFSENKKGKKVSNERKIGKFGRFGVAAAVAVIAVGVNQPEKRYAKPIAGLHPEDAVLTESEANIMRIVEFKAQEDGSINVRVLVKSLEQLATSQSKQSTVQNVRTDDGRLENHPVIDASGEEALKKYETELPQILVIVEANPEIFDPAQDSADLSMYFPIYRAAQDKFGVSWYLLWIIHQQESTASRNPAAFVIEGNDQYGCMARNVFYHPQESVDAAFSGLEYLDNLPQRHKDDGREIVYAAEEVREYSDAAGSLLGGLKRYSASGPAISRYARYQTLSNIFGAN